MNIDNNDAGHALKAETLNTLAAEIRRRHESFQASRDASAGRMQEAIASARELACLVEEARATLGGARFAAWWRDQNLPAGWGKKYLSLARSKSTVDILDKQQLRIIGILPEAQSHNEGQARDVTPSAYSWIKWAGKLVAHWAKVNIRAMDRCDRMAALRHLEPIQKIIADLERKP